MMPDVITEEPNTMTKKKISLHEKLVTLAAAAILIYIFLKILFF
jgi:hypothetical protein